jgi:hypothetical protein
MWEATKASQFLPLHYYHAALHRIKCLSGIISSSGNNFGLDRRKLLAFRAQKWRKSSQNAPGNLPINSAESKTYGDFGAKTPHPTLFTGIWFSFRLRSHYFFASGTTVAVLLVSVSTENRSYFESCSTKCSRTPLTSSTRASTCPSACVGNQISPFTGA